ncbi:isochorismatase family protein [Corynebacterium gerontici]|uniref:Vibriobactin-specific isochorismatase n=1 Tax=Corynebacterium gerontici TaxID=2079234 RepID=A0A3G6J330_9CORY|nr:isochorismatase family protein [Corynebacterium gerontici]AZA12113.1 Vibriobactin-specific isochorismatase [Corynebacterium gerontici]
MPIPPINGYPLCPSNPLALLENRNTAEHWRIDPTRAALLVHDMQQYFIDAYCREQEPIATVIPAIQKLIAAADAAEVPVFYSVQPPEQKSPRRGLLREFWGEGMQTEQEAAIIPELSPVAHHHIVTKWRYSAFARTDLRHALAFEGRDQLIITGVYGHMGCQVSAVDAFMNDIQPFLVGDAIADFSEEDHARTLNWVASRCGKVIASQEALDHLGAKARAGAAS